MPISCWIVRISYDASPTAGVITIALGLASSHGNEPVTIQKLMDQDLVSDARKTPDVPKSGANGLAYDALERTERLRIRSNEENQSSISKSIASRHSKYAPTLNPERDP